MFPRSNPFLFQRIDLVAHHCCGDDDGGDGVFADLFGLVRMIAKA